MSATTRNREAEELPDWLPDWARDLPGVRKVLAIEPLPEFKSGKWVVHLELPNDLAELESEPAFTDPLLLIWSGSTWMREMDGKMFELVRMARRQGRSWTEIGRALGVTKQTAWTRFSGED